MTPDHKMKKIKRVPAPKNGNGQTHISGNGRNGGANPPGGAVAPATLPTGPQPNWPHYGQAQYGQAYFALGSTLVPTSLTAKVKMELRPRTAPSLIDYVGNHISMITGNSAFTNQQPLPATLQAALDNLILKNAEFISAHDLAKQSTIGRNMAADVVVELMIARGAYVQTASGGNPDLIVSTGLGVASPPTPATTLSAPENLRVELTGELGTMILLWMAVAGNEGYQVRCSKDVMPRQWEQLKRTGKPKLVLTDMELGTRYVFQVCTMGGATGQSQWSPEVARTAA